MHSLRLRNSATGGTDKLHALFPAHPGAAGMGVGLEINPKILRWHYVSPEAMHLDPLSGL
ncbi:MAG: hypothetical protein K9N07_07440 [Candidatus Cloacimonetes bacterium]|nr:hypothetical protein [Candidatus Cloacimonadota bacterium]